MAKTYSPQQRFGGIKALNRRMSGRNDHVAQHKEAIADELMAVGAANISDVIEWDSQGNVRVRASADIPRNVLSAIKEIKTVQTVRDGVETSTLELKMHDKIGSLKVLAKAAGLLEAPEVESNKPSVVGITMKGPDVIDIEVEGEDG